MRSVKKNLKKYNFKCIMFDCNVCKNIFKKSDRVDVGKTRRNEINYMKMRMLVIFFNRKKF